jgi:nucleoside-diphosphate-sugar epimerase
MSEEANPRAAPQLPRQAPIAVTGAAGYLASWVVTQLLDEGQRVHATVRSLADDAKLAHLHDLARRHPGRLALFEADLMKEGSFDLAFEGCGAVVHTASPYVLGQPRDVQGELVGPARQGSLNVIGAVNRAASVRRLVLTASVVSMFSDARDLAGRPGHRLAEADWNRHSSEGHNPYAYSKRVAEEAAWAAARAQSRWSLVTIHPGAIFGPSLSRRVDATSVDMVVQFLRGAFRPGVPRLWLGVVDVRDVAAAHVRAVLRAEAAGRYIVVGRSLALLDIARALRPGLQGLPDKLPTRELPKALVWLAAPFVGMTREYVSKNVAHPIDFDSRRSVKELGLAYRRPEQTFHDHVAQLLRDQLLPTP